MVCAERERLEQEQREVGAWFNYGERTASFHNRDLTKRGIRFPDLSSQ
jgi:hypothetical protein